MSVTNLGKFVYSVVVNNSVSGEMNKVDKNAKKATSSIAKMESKIRSLQSGIIGFGAAAAASFVAFNSLMSGASSFSNNISNIATRTGIATDSLQNLSNIYSNIAGISLDKAQNDLAGLADQINQIKSGFKSSEDFLRIGVGINQGSTTESVMNDLRTKLGGQSDVKATLMLQQIGLDEGFLRILRASSDEIQKLNRIPILTKAQVQNTISAGKAMDAVKKQIIGLKNVAVASLAPVVTAEFGKFFNMIDSNKDRIIGFFGNIINFTKNFAMAIGNTIGLLSDFIGWIGNTSNGMEWLAIAIGGIMLAFRPMLAAFTGLVLLADDFAVWQRGGEAAFGSIYAWIGKFSDELKPLGQTIAWVFLYSFGANTILRIATFFSSVLGATKVFSASLLTLLNPIFLGFAALGGAIYFGKKAYDKYTGNKQENAESQTTASNSNWVQSLFPNMEGETGAGKMTLAPSAQNSSSSTNNETVNNFNITGNNPEEIAKQIKEIFEEQTRMQNNSLSFNY